MDYEPSPAPAVLAEIGAALGSPVSFLKRIHGGQSATTDILMRGDGTKVALRRHGRWSIGFDDAIADRERIVLRSVQAGGVPVPKVIWSGKIGPVTAIITEFVDGAPILNPANPILWAEQLADTLAEVHSVTVNLALETALKNAPPSPVDIVPSTDIGAHPDGSALLAARSALVQTIGRSKRFAHGDYWPGNLLWHQGAIAAVVDWEAAVLGDPASDVAYCYAEMRYLGRDDAAYHFVNRYQEKTGRRLTSLPYWLVTALCRAVPELHTYVDGWSGLGHVQDIEDVRSRMNQLIRETLIGDIPAG